MLLPSSLRAMSSAAAPSAAAAPATQQQAPPQAPPEGYLEVFVDGEPITVPKNFTVIQACDAAGVDIPRFV